MNQSAIGENSKPTQLACRGGHWILELECLVPVTKEIFRPTKRQVEGKDLILFHLENSVVNRELVSGATRLIDATAVTGGVAEDRAFEPREGHWVPATNAMSPAIMPPANAPREATAQRPADPGPEVARALSEVARAIGLLNETCDRILRKVVRLEERMAALGDGARKPGAEAASRGPASIPAAPNAPVIQYGGSPSIRPEYGNPAIVDVRAEDEPIPASRPSDKWQAAVPLASKATSYRPPGMQSEGRIAIPRSKAPSARPAPTQPRTTAHPAAPAPDTMPPVAVSPPSSGHMAAAKSVPPSQTNRLRMPNVKDANTVAKQLIGEKIRLTENKRANLGIGPETRNFYACNLLDDEGHVAGAMLCDVKGTVVLGSSLLMLPQRQIEEQLAAQKALPDVVEALSEIFNTLSAVINNMPGNPHVRTTPAEAFEFSSYRWVASASKRVEFEDVSGGRLIIVSR